MHNAMKIVVVVVVAFVFVAAATVCLLLLLFLLGGGGLHSPFAPTWVFCLTFLYIPVSYEATLSKITAELHVFTCVTFSHEISFKLCLPILR